MFSTLSSLVLFSLASSIFAKTDLSGCTTSDVQVNGVASLIYYVPSSGEVCSILDCGGGQAPPISSVPGCPAYTGTAVYTPSFLAGYTPGATLTPTGPRPTGSLLFDSSIRGPSSTLVPYASRTVSFDLTDTTTTLGAGGSGTSLVTSALVYDTAVDTQVVTNTKLTTSTPAPSSATANAASGSTVGKELVFAIVGAAAGLAIL